MAVRAIRYSSMIRLARPDDGAAAARIYDPVVARTAISFELDPPGPVEMKRRIVTALAFAPWLVEERDGIVRGYAYASKHRERAAYQWSVDVGVYVDEEHRRSGVGKALYEIGRASCRERGEIEGGGGWCKKK